MLIYDLNEIVQIENRTQEFWIFILISFNDKLNEFFKKRCTGTVSKEELEMMDGYQFYLHAGLEK